jgi:hypothetical protein
MVLIIYSDLIYNEKKTDLLLKYLSIYLFQLCII